MKKAIRRSFDLCQTNNCLKTEKSKFFKIFDLEGACCFICKDDTHQSTSFICIDNKDTKEIHFLAIDRCLFDDSHNDKRCDCVIFDDATFCFIEIKDKKNRSGARKEAYEQLETTIELFQKKMTFGDLNLEAIVCLGETKSVPKSTSANMGQVKYFFDRFNVDLKEGNRIAF